VHAASVAVPPDVAPSEAIETNYQAMLMLQREQAQRMLVERAQTWSTGGIVVRCEIVDAHPSTGLADAAEDAGTDLLVVGTHGRTGVKRLFLGSVAERTARISPCDVLIARGPPPPGGSYRRVVVGTDFSETSLLALERALAFAPAGAQMEVVHCWQVPAPLYAGFGDALSELQGDMERDAVERGKQVVERFKGRGAEVSFTALQGPPAESLRNRLESSPPDLLALGTHGRTGVRRWLLGSIAEVLARHAPCSVLIAGRATSE
jgi:nucleotide-binding universal stress UspA family protein